MASDEVPGCPVCGSSRAVVKNGHLRGKQNWRCNDCGRSFVAEPQVKRIHPEVRVVMERLLDRQVAVAIIAEAAGVALSTVYKMRKA